MRPGAAIRLGQVSYVSYSPARGGEIDGGVQAGGERPDAARFDCGRKPAGAAGPPGLA